MVVKILSTVEEDAKKTRYLLIGLLPDKVPPADLLSFKPLVNLL